jgi:hypothetical protein
MRPRKAGLCPLKPALLQNYCSLCFRGIPGITHGEGVDPSSSRIDKIQAQHSRAGNGIRLIDFDASGDCCAWPYETTCNAICLVCGKVVFENNDAIYRKIRKVLNNPSRLGLMEVEELVKANGAIWARPWETVIHSTCAITLPGCGCVVPLGTSQCPTHVSFPKWIQLVDPIPLVVSSKTIPGQRLDKKGVCRPQRFMQISLPKLDPPALQKPYLPVTFIKTVKNVLERTKPSSVSTRVGMVRKTNKLTPIPKGVILDTWLQEKRTEVVHTPFHNSSFDINLHGYFRVFNHKDRTNRLVYKLPGGRVVPLEDEGVHVMTDGGNMELDRAP